MSVTDVAARIQQLQSQFALLSQGIGTPASGIAGGEAFAEAMTSATTGTTTAASSTGLTSGVPGAPGTTTVPLDGAGTTVSGTAGEQAVVAEARKYLGIPYVWGGTDPKTGLDCSGLVQLVYKNLGVDLPRVSYQQATQGQKVPSLAQARPGDLVAFGSPSVNHIGIYIGDGKMIHAPRPGQDVEVSDVYATPVAIRRVLPEGSSSARMAPAGLAGMQGLSVSTPYAGLFQTAASKHGVPATLLAAVAKQESGYDATAVSPAGARGLMQIMPGTAQGLGVDPMQPAQAVDGAARLLKDLIDRFGRVDHALAAYNAGPGAVIRYGGIPPYPETQRYVPAVLGIQRDLEAAA